MPGGALRAEALATGAARHSPVTRPGCWLSRVAWGTESRISVSPGHNSNFTHPGLQACRALVCGVGCGHLSPPKRLLRGRGE